VVIGAGGRVREPGRWAAGAPRGLHVDPPLSHRFGALGLEVERHDIRLISRRGRDVRFGAVMLRSRDGLVKVVVDNGSMFVADGGVFEDEQAAARAAASGGGGGFTGQIAMSVPETVTVPWAAVEGESRRPGRDAVLARLADVNRRWDQAPAVRQVTGGGLPEASARLADLFPDSEYEVPLWFRDVRVARYPDLRPGAPLSPQLSMGAPLGGGVLAGVEATLEDIGRPAGTGVKPRDHHPMRFGWRVARGYLMDVTGAAPSLEDMDGLAPDWDVVRIAEAMTVAFMIVCGVLTAEARFGDPDVFAKNLMPVAARQGLYEFWAELSPRLQDFFARRADEIRQIFELEYQVFYPDFPAEFSKSWGRPRDARVDLWQVEFHNVRTRRRIGTVGELFDEILRPDPDGPRIGPKAYLVARADSGDGPDRSRGGGWLAQFVLELRSFGVSKSGGGDRHVDLPMVADDARRLEGVARQGDAAAAFALRLAATAQGRLVVARLREALAAASAAGRAVGRLRRAAGWYLDRFPGERAALEKALERAAARLGVPLVPAGGTPASPARAGPGPAGEAGGAGGGPVVTLWDRPAAPDQVARVRALAGRGRLTEAEVTRVVNLAVSLGMPAGGEKGWLDALARDVGLHRQDGLVVREARRVPGGQHLSRLAGLLAVAALVFDDGGAGRDELASLRRLADLAPGARGGGAPGMLAGLQAEYRWQYSLADAVPVSAARLRELVTLTGQAKTALPEGSPVTRDQLAEQVAAAWRRQARGHLSGNAGLRLGVAERRDLIVRMLGAARPRREDLAAVLDLLAAASAAERGMLADEQVYRLLVQAVPEGDPLRGRHGGLLTALTAARERGGGVGGAASRALPEGSPVTKDRLEDQVAAALRRRARGHLSGDAGLRLGVAGQRDLIAQLLDAARPRYRDLAAVLDLLAAANTVERRMLLDGQVGQLLVQAVPEGDALRGRVDGLLASLRVDVYGPQFTAAARELSGELGLGAGAGGAGWLVRLLVGLAAHGWLVIPPPGGLRDLVHGVLPEVVAEVTGGPVPPDRPGLGAALRAAERALAAAERGAGPQWRSARWQVALDLLAGHAPPPPPPPWWRRLKDEQQRPQDRAEAFAAYDRARLEHQRELEAALAMPEVAPAVWQEERAARERLKVAEEGLAAWGITDPQQAARASEAFSRSHPRRRQRPGRTTQGPSNPATPGGAGGLPARARV